LKSNKYAPIVDEPKVKKDISLDFLFQDQIKHHQDLNKHGTAKSYITCYRHLLSFWGAEDLSHIPAISLKPLFVRDFETYLINKGLNEGSSKKYVAIFRTIYEKGKINGLFQETIDPFIAFKVKRNSPTPEFLDKREVEILMGADLSDDPRLEKLRRQFLFQLFAQGLRISDLMTLRWGNYHPSSGELRFKQFKTKRPHVVILHKYSWRLLGQEIPGGISDILQNKISGKIDGSPFEMTYDDWVKKYVEYSKMRFQEIIEGNQKAIEELTVFKNELNDKLIALNVLISLKVKDFAHNNPSLFIFDILPNKDFKDFDFNLGRGLPIQLYRIMSSKSVLYNRGLKMLQHKIGITKCLSSHIMRATYASLMIDQTKEDIFSISSLLGHSKVGTTQGYINNLQRTREEEAANSFGEIFFR
jgi:site-specific recombinase XerD